MDLFARRTQKLSKTPETETEIVYSSDSDCEYRIIRTRHKFNADSKSELSQQCNLCPKRFRSRDSLQTHINRHHNTVEIFQKIVALPDINCLLSEMKTESTESNSKLLTDICCKCNESYAVEQIEQHANVCVGIHGNPADEELQKCSKCGEDYIESKIAEHARTCIILNKDKVVMHVNDSIFSEDPIYEQCKKCSERYDATDLEEHLKVCPGINTDDEDIIISLDPSMSQCQQCKEIYVIADIEEHIKVCVHSQNLIVPVESLCPICGKIFPSFKLKNHMKIHGEKSFLCTICGVGHKTNTALKRHTQSHTKDYKFECNVCNKKCSTRHTLREHMRIHTGVKEFRCPLCEKSFTQQNGLKQHMTHCHIGVKKFACEYCEKRFYSKQHLKEHLKMHTKERAYVCEICCTRFAYANTLQKHNKKFHPVVSAS